MLRTQGSTELDMRFRPHAGAVLAVLGLAAALFSIPGCVSADTGSPGGAVISAPVGALRGEVEDGVAVYRGIPFALAPTGDRRWAPPEAVPDWEGVRDARTFGDACPQPRSRPGSIYALDLGGMSEDCLSLNVWAPETAGNAPVLVWIHGGALTSGASSLPMYDGARMARETGLVVVSVNYRLGVLGYLAHPELSAESEQGISGNYGLQDQIAALEWIERNISAFGGDPDNVTIAGESAGALSVMLLMASPEAEGLFDKAIAQSAYMVSMAPLRGEANGHPSAEDAGAAFAGRVGLESLDALRATPAEDLVRLGWQGGFVPFGIIDGVYLTDQMTRTFDRGEQARVPILAGYNDGEIRSLRFLLPPLPESADQYVAEIRSRYGELADAFLDLYPPDALEESLLAATRDAMYGWTSERLADRQTALGQPSFLYLFDHGYPAADEMGLHAFHASEIPYVFGTLKEAVSPWPEVPQTQEERALSDAMLHYWASFARSGRPSAEGAPDWPAYGSAATGMVFADVPHAEDALARARYELHEEVVCRRLADGTLQWNWNIGIISPPLPGQVPACE